MYIINGLKYMFAFSKLGVFILAIYVKILIFIKRQKEKKKNTKTHIKEPNINHKP